MSARSAKGQGSRRTCRNVSKAGFVAFSRDKRACARSMSLLSDHRIPTHLGKRIVACILHIRLRPIGRRRHDDVANRLYDRPLLSLSVLQGIGEGRRVFSNLKRVEKDFGEKGRLLVGRDDRRIGFLQDLEEFLRGCQEGQRAEVGRRRTVRMTSMS